MIRVACSYLLWQKFNEGQEGPRSRSRRRRRSRAVKFPASSASLRNELSSSFKLAAQLDGRIANSTCVNSIAPCGRGAGAEGSRRKAAEPLIRRSAPPSPEREKGSLGQQAAMDRRFGLQPLLFSW